MLTEDQDATQICIAASPTGRGMRLETVQLVPSPRDRVFNFFADAFQLEVITPSWLHFSVVTEPPISMRADTRIDYRLRLRGLPIRWQSLISAWEPPYRFVDEQTRGPYRRWRHEHLFEEVDGGTRCRDVVDYEVPGGWPVDALLVRSELRRIFRFRRQKLAEIFGS
jgi:ligand-binding SRPBCC domain-containing protein